MISNLEGLTKFLVSWLQDKAKESGTKNGCVGMSGGVDSAVVFALCCRAFPKTIGVMMPCHSRPDSLSQAKAVMLGQAALGYDSYGILVPLETAFDSIKQAVPGEPLDRRLVEGSLRSCLRAPVLDYVAKMHNALIYGTGNRDEDEIFRYYQKRGDGCVDNNVIVGLHKTEVRQLALYLGIPDSVVSAVPTADLWGGAEQTDEKELGVTYDEIEWVTRLNDATAILQTRGYCETQAEFLSENNYFTPRQALVIEKAFNLEKSSRHKAEPPPGPTRQDLVYFVT